MSDEEKWKEARTLEEVGEVTALWIEGKIEYNPENGGGVDEETIPLREVLAYFNRNGFVTTFSQPGMPILDGCGQRACVEGYASEDIAKKIYTLGLYSDLIVIIYESASHWGFHFPVTVDDYHPFTWCGFTSGDDRLDSYVGHYHNDAIAAIAMSWQVTVIDPSWGRNDLLWEKVKGILSGEADHLPYEASPVPHLELDTDFVY